MYIRNGKPFDILASHTIGDYQYPAGWFFDGTEAYDKGIISVPEPFPPTVLPTQKALINHFELVGQDWQAVWDVVDLTPEELEAMKPPVPQTVTRRQARQALLLRGMLDAVPAAIEALEDPIQREMAKIEWEDSQEFNRTRPLVIQIAGAIGLDSDGLDELFIFAATL